MREADTKVSSRDGERLGGSWLWARSARDESLDYESEFAVRRLRMRMRCICQGPWSEAHKQEVAMAIA